MKSIVTRTIAGTATSTPTWARYLVVISLLVVVQTGSRASLAAVPDFLKSYPKKSFHVVYSGSESIGKTEAFWSLEGKELKFSEKTDLLMKLYNKQQKMKTETTVWTSDKLLLSRIDFRFETDGGVIAISGKRKNGQLHLEINQAGKMTESVFALKEPAIVSSIIRPYILMKGLPRGGKPKTLKFNILELSAYTHVSATAKIVQEKSGPGQTPSYLVTLKYMNQVMTSRLSANGDLLEENSELAGLPILAVPLKQDAFHKKSLTGTQEDLVDRAKVEFPPLHEARTRPSLTVEVSGIDLSTFDVHRHRQTRNKNRLTIVKESLPVKTSSVDELAKKSSLKNYLRSEPQIDVTDPLIQATAKKIVGSEKDSWKRALMIHRYVFETLEKVPTITVPNAVEVLKTKRGDCNEHAALTTALMRAAGVPARTVVGLVYSDRFYGTNGFYYHAWVEIFSGETWTSLDPTWDQVPSDSTHIAFVDGALDKQLQVTNLMGKIKLKLVDAK